MAWELNSASFIHSAGRGSTSLVPAAPMKLPITAMSGLNTFEVIAGPRSGKVPSGPPAPALPGGTCAVGCSGAGGGSMGAACSGARRLLCGRRRWCPSRRFERGQPRFEGLHPRLVVLAQGVELAPQAGEFLAQQFSRGWRGCGRRLRRGGLGLLAASGRGHEQQGKDQGPTEAFPV